MNIFVEGLQGTGKSTLLNRLAQRFPNLPAYREGDACSVELAWCAYFSIDAFSDAKRAYPEFAGEMDKLSIREGEHIVLPYTRVKGNHAFFSEMENYEIYNGRIPFDRFCAIILDRYTAYRGDGLFECALLQNIVETLLLFYCKEEDCILDFYREIWACLKGKEAVVLYLDANDIASNISLACRERVNEMGEEVWFAAMMDYFCSAPLSKRNGWTTSADLVEYMRLRQRVERRILTEIVCEQCVLLPEKQYQTEAVFDMLHRIWRAAK